MNKHASVNQRTEEGLEVNEIEVEVANLNSGKTEKEKMIRITNVRNREEITLDPDQVEELINSLKKL